MSLQFVDLFDYKNYGPNHHAMIFLFLGSLVSWTLTYGGQIAVDAELLIRPPAFASGELTWI